MPDIPHRISAPRERADDLITTTDGSDSHHADLTINAPIDSVFAAVSSVEGLSGWWTTDTGGSPEPGGELRFTFSDGVAVMRVEERTPPALERWTCLGHSGQPEWAHTTVTFRLTEVNPAATRLEFTHGGLRPRLDCYEHCSAGWNYLMRSLASYVETGTGHPVSRDEEPSMNSIAAPGNIEIITRFEHAFRAADHATIDELADPGLADHNPAPGHEPTLAGFKQKVAGFKAVFPDLVEDLQDIIASGDTVATRWIVTGSLQQEFMGIPASGQAIRVEGMNFYRLKDGRVTDIWTQFDGVALMQQLGAIPA